MKSIWKLNFLQTGKQTDRFPVRLLFFLFSLCPLWAYAQSEEDIRRAMDMYDYETPIATIAVATGDSVLTPLRAQALKAMNRYAEALKEWNSLLKPDSTDTKLLMELAECYRQTNRPPMAAACYEKAASLHPDNAFFRQQHIRALLAADNYEKARDFCQVWIAQDSTSASGFKYLGMAYEGMKQDSMSRFNAFQAFEQAYLRDSLDAQTVAHIAAIFNDTEQYGDAMAITENYRLTDTTSIDVNRQNAKAYCLMKEYKTAISRYEALKQLGDHSFTTLYYLGISHFADQWFYGAQENLLEAHKKNPDDVNVLYYLGRSCVYTSWKKEGLEYIKEAFENIIPADSLVLRMQEALVECHSLQQDGDPYEYIDAMKDLYQLNKKYTLFYRIATVYDNQKDFANAVYFYEKYMKQVPKDKQTILDSEGVPMQKAKTWYETAARRVEEIKAEEFFRGGKEPSKPSKDKP